MPPSFSLTKSSALAWTLLLVLGLANVAVDMAFVRAARRTASQRPPPLSHYSFIEDDYPPHLPVPRAHKAALLPLEDSVHYHFPSSPNTAAWEWRYTGAACDGNIRLGPSHKFFNTGFSYELHCARVVASALQNPAPLSSVSRTTRGEREHVTRCLNVLRRATLCAADAALEPELGELGALNFTLHRARGERRCADVGAMYEAMRENWAGWREVQRAAETGA